MTIGDLLRWKPGRFRLGGSLDLGSPLLDTEFSWIVCIRARTPVLPPLRGNELIVVPDCILEELGHRESIGWTDVASHLQTLPISGVVSDHEAAAEGIEGIAVLEAVSTISPDIEIELNRELTERRSRLYQLGSNLARLYSSASLGGLDLSSFLRLAEEQTGLAVALMTNSGRILGASNNEFSPSSSVVVEDAATRRVTRNSLDWISQPVSGAGLPDNVYLVTAIEADQPGDEARLVLEQTGEALGLIFDRFPPLEAPSMNEEARRILADLAVNGALPAAARRRLNRVMTDVDLEGRLRLLITPDHAGQQPATSSNLAFEVDDVWFRLIEDASYADLVTPTEGRLIVSEPFVGIDELHSAVGPALSAYRLLMDGHLAGSKIDLGMPGSGGALTALLMVVSTDREILGQLASYADAMLGNLERYDQSRGMRLVETLGTYLDAGAVVADAAERLGVHRNTLSYRIARIIEVSGHDLSNPAVRFDLQLAIAIRRLQPADG